MCDSGRSECLLSSSEEEKQELEQQQAKKHVEEEMNGAVAVPGAGVAVETLHSFGFIPLHASLNMNLSTTQGCECGCILDNIQPGINYSLVVIISSNQSSCGDQDEEDHHHLKWILNVTFQTCPLSAFSIVLVVILLLLFPRLCVNWSTTQLPE